MTTPVYIVGSIAYDRIMDFPGRFADHILPDKVHMLNVAFTVDSMVEYIGGTAGNIAYALAKLGERPVILASIGRDRERYFEWLTEHDIDTESITVSDDEFTASAYITTDLADNQITAFNPGAMKQPCRIEIDAASSGGAIGIAGASNLEDMERGRAAFLDHGMRYIFDPGQSLPMWGDDALAAMIAGAEVLIANDYEIEMIMSRTGMDRNRLLDRCGAVITTLGEHGSTVTTPDGEAELPAVALAAPPSDPTGAGDAYRGGLIKGMLEGRGLAESAKLGTVVASFAVEVQGTQSYDFTPAQFEERYRRTFG